MREDKVHAYYYENSAPIALCGINGSEIMFGNGLDTTCGRCKRIIKSRMAKSKICNICKLDKPLSEFIKRDNQVRAYACKKCLNRIGSEKYYKTHPVIQQDDLEGEIWRDVIGHEGVYQVSNYSRIKSLPRNGTKRIPIILNHTTTPFGYLTVNLKNKGKNRQNRVHRLVAKAFIPNPENKPFINHINGIKSDNRIENLEWCTANENAFHSYHILGNKHAIKASLIASEKNRIYTDDKILDILNRRASGNSCIEIASIYNTDRSVITKLVRENSTRLGIIIPKKLPRKRYQINNEQRILNQRLNRGKKILAYKIPNMEFVKEYLAVREMAKELNLDRKSIALVLKGVCKQHKGYTFKLK